MFAKHDFTKISEVIRTFLTRNPKLAITHQDWS